MKIAVTGATGFVGSRLVAELQGAGHEVVALVRKESKIQELLKYGVDIVEVDLLQDTGLAASIPNNIDVVVHCAGGGRIRSTRDYEIHNFVITHNLLQAVCRLGISHFVLLSSIAAAGPGRRLVEELPCEPLSRYGKAKRKAELACLQYQHQFEVSIIRAPAIYGGDVRFLGFFRSVLRGVCPLPPGKAMSMIHVDDCVAAMVLMIHNPKRARGVFYIEDGCSWSWKTLALGIHAEFQRRSMGRFLFTIPIPSFVVYLMACCNEFRLLFSQKGILITRDKWLDGKALYWCCHSGKLQEQLGWRARITAQEGIRRSVDEYVAKGGLA